MYASNYVHKSICEYIVIVLKKYGNCILVYHLKLDGTSGKYIT
jgi:hypothetical protein